MNHYTDDEMCKIISNVLGHTVTKSTAVDEMKKLLNECVYPFDQNESPYNLFCKTCIVYERLDISNDEMIKRSFASWTYFHKKSYQYRDRNFVSDSEWVILTQQLSVIGRQNLEKYDLRVRYLRYPVSIKVKYRGINIFLLRMITYEVDAKRTTFEVVFLNITEWSHFEWLRDQVSKKIKVRRIYMTNNIRFKCAAVNFITFRQLNTIIKILQSQDEFDWTNQSIYTRAVDIFTSPRLLVPRRH